MHKKLLIIFIWLLLLLESNKIYAQANGVLADKEIKIEVSEGTLGQYLNMIAMQGVNLSYSSNQLKLNKKLSISKGSYKAGQLLRLLLAQEKVEIKTEDHKIILYVKASSLSKSFTLSGFVYSGNSMESLPYASIKLLGTNLGVQSNDFGFYSIALPKGINYIQLSYSGYGTIRDTLDITADKVINFQLQPGLLLREVVVQANKGDGKIADIQEVDLEMVKELPMTLGETDPLKALQLKAGISAGVFGGSLHVRGGSPDQNLVLLDGIPVYNYNHFTGLLSIFNNDAVKRVDFFKGAFPSRYEGRLSAVIDVKTKDGDMQKYHGAVNIGLLTSSAMFEGPLIKNKISFMASFRRSWIDGLTRVLYGGSTGLKYYLYDGNIKLNYRIDSTTRIYLSAYKGSDRFSLGLSEDNTPAIALNWSNQLLSLRWNKVHSSRMFHNSTLVLSDFKNQLEDLEQGGNTQFNRITDLGLDNDVSYNWSNTVKSTFGIKAKLTRFRSAPDAEISARPEDQQSAQLQIYTDNDIQISPKFNLKAGLHYTAFITSGKTYHSYQPRSTLTFSPTEKHHLYGSYSIMAQFYHQITINTLSMPNEFRAPTTAELPPQQSTLYELGYFYQLASEGRIGIQFYKKNITDLLMYRSQQNALEGILAPKWRDRLINGKGNSRGIEIEYTQKFKWLSVQAAYTLSKTMFTFPQVNNGQRFMASYDLRNQFNAAVSIKMGSKWTTSGLFTYSSGQLITLPSYALPDLDHIISGTTKNESIYWYANEPNNYRLPDNYSLNIGAVYTSTPKPGPQGRLHFGINNVLGKPAPFMVTTEIEDNQLRVNQIIPFRLLPYVGYSYTF